MNTIKLLFYSLILFFAFSCQKENDQTANFKALKDGNYWVPEINSAMYSLTEKKFMIYSSKKYHGYNENLYMTFNASDLSGPSKFSAIFSHLIGGDGISAQFRITPDPLNIIKITSLDTALKKITGNFSVKLSRDEFYQQPDTILLTEGFFSLPYQEVYTYSK